MTRCINKKLKKNKKKEEQKIVQDEKKKKEKIKNLELLVTRKEVENLKGDALTAQLKKHRLYSSTGTADQKRKRISNNMRTSGGCLCLVEKTTL